MEFEYDSRHRKYTICKEEQESETGLYEALPECEGRVYTKMSGIECDTCHGWFCY